jgi:hypothetical protein
MESNSVAGRVHCSATSAQMLASQAPDLPVVMRGKIKVKGKGVMVTYWVNNPEYETSEPPPPVETVQHENNCHSNANDDDDDHKCDATLDTYPDM